MSLYRLAVYNGRLIREKRRLLKWWCWSFNRCEEDYLNTAKNALVENRKVHASLMKRIAHHEDIIKKTKDRLIDGNGIGPTVRDSWSLRREPVVLRQDVKVPPLKKLPPKPKPEPITLSRTVVDPPK